MPRKHLCGEKRKMASVIWILSVVLYAEFMCAVSAKKLVSLDCQDENHGVHGKDSLLKCFLNSGGESVKVTSATWRRPGEKRPLIMFIKDKVKEPEDPRFSFKQLQMSGSNIDVSFLVRNTVRTDEGKYECEVATDSGEAKAVVSLSVTATYSKPDMSSVPEKDLQEGMEVTLFCNASGGYPVGMIHWYDQHGTNWTRSAEMTVVETTDKRTNLSSKFTLRASSITPQYRCLVLNNNGVEEGKAEFDLKFREKEFVSLDCQDENHGVHGKDSLLKCFLNSGGINMTVTAASWRRPGEKRPLIMFKDDKVGEPEDPRFSFKQLQMSGSNIDVSFLVRNTVRTDEGKYECVVVTDSGEDTAVVSLSVTVAVDTLKEKATGDKGSTAITVIVIVFVIVGSLLCGLLILALLRRRRAQQFVSLDCQDENHGVHGKDSLLKCFLNSGGINVTVTAATWRRPGEKRPLIMFINDKVGEPEDPRFSFKQLQMSGSNIDVSFLVRNTVRTDEGKYECVVVTDSGEDTAVVSLSVTEFVSLDCQDENHGVHGKDSLLKCFLNSGGRNKTVLSAAWWRPGEERPLIMFKDDKVGEPEDPRFSFKQLQMSGSNIDVSFLVRNTVRTDEGKYECVVVTDSGEDTAVVSLSVTVAVDTLKEKATGDKGSTAITVIVIVFVIVGSLLCGLLILALLRRRRAQQFVSLDCQDENHGVHGKDSLLKCFLNSGGINVTVTAATWRRPGEKRPLIMFINDKVGEPEDPRFSFKQLQMSGSNIDVSFLVRNTVRTDEGKYECVVVTDSGEDTAVVSLSVTELVSLDCQDENHRGLGKDSLLKCFLNSGGESVMVAWATWRRPGEDRPLIMFRNDKVLEPEDPRFSFKQIQMSGSNIDMSFLVRNTVRTDEGKYECEVVTESGEAKAVVSLSVTAPYSKPDMSSVPEKDLQEGMEVTLFCNASGGYPVAMIHWYDPHGTNWTRSAEMTVVETTDKRTNLSSKFTLKASSSTPLYGCLVLNNNGVEEGKAEFVLKFQEKEFLSLDCQDINRGLLGKDSLLKCFLNSGGINVTVTAATWRRPGEKRPLIKFINDNVSVREDPRFSFKQSQLSGSNIDVSFLVRNTLWTDEGKYECQVQTDSGYAKAVVSLSVTEKVPHSNATEAMSLTYK
ncbi:uncharacterized protein LOC135248991 [Anguilla rostrata]|uniref:uncharacterized protein LOC135248991 n=1 Tax=Anguilla rostrata TaxID=7938 RepID=UPI0030D4A008